MWTNIIVLTILTLTSARNVEYTDEDARRDILSILSHAFGLKINEPSAKRNPIQIHRGLYNEGIKSREISRHAKNNAFNDSEIILNRHIDNIEQDVYQPSGKQIKAKPRVERPKEIFCDDNKKRITNTDEARITGDVNNTQGRIFAQNNQQTTNTQRNNNERISNIYKYSTVFNEIKPTPSLVSLKFKTQNASRNKGVENTRKIDASEARFGNATQNVKEADKNKTAVLKEITTVRNQETTRKTQKGAKKVDDDKWIWSTEAGTTAMTTPDLVDRAAFSGNNCPKGKVKFGNDCVDEE